MIMPIPDDATIRDVLRLLTDPEEYVRGVLGNMHECRSHYGTASVKIGVTGAGHAPHYRIEYPVDGTTKFFAAYNGRNHEQREDWGELTLDALLGRASMPDHPLFRESWSTRVMQLEEVIALLGEIRGVRR
jgi:hypothetical protein